MEDYKVKEEDLIGEIKDFPIEVVQKMVDCQVEQGNKADVTVFQKSRCEMKEDNGFSWNETAEGFSFWSNIVDYKEFNIFFEKYPKRELEGVNEQISNEPHLLCSYEDYKKGKMSSLHKPDGLSKRTIRLLTLGWNFNKTKDEEEEYVKLQKEVEIDNKNEKFTTITHEITDLYFELKNIHDDDIRHEKYELIGRKQCEIEIIKEEFKNK
jgi:hypothetical protein